MLKEGNLQSPQKPEVGIVEPPGMVHWEGQDVGMGMVVSRKVEKPELYIIVAFDNKVFVSLYLRILNQLHYI